MSESKMFVIILLNTFLYFVESAAVLNEFEYVLSKSCL